MHAAERIRSIPELSVVRLTHAIEYQEKQLPMGAQGTVVHAWSDGEHYAVEFATPFRCVISVTRSDIRPM